MKESITKFDLEAAFKALDELDMPVANKVKANRPALTEIFSHKSKFDALMEEYYDISNMAELDDAKEAREAEVAQAKLARIEKIVDLDAESPEDLLPSYVGKFIIQCPQCMTLFYKNPEDVEASEEDPNTVNVSEVCQHCGNEAGYTLIGKVGAATSDEQDELNDTQEVDVDSTEDVDDLDAPADEASDEELDDSEDMADFDLEELDLDIEDVEEDEEAAEEEAKKKDEAYAVKPESQILVEDLLESSDAEVVRAIQGVFNDISKDEQSPAKDVVNKLIDAIPDEKLDEAIAELKDNFKNIKLNKNDIAIINTEAGDENIIPEDTDTVGKVLELCDAFEWAKKSPELIKLVLSLAISAAAAIEPTAAGEVASIIVKLIPAEALAKIWAVVSTTTNPLAFAGHSANKLYKAVNAASLTEGSNDVDVSAEDFEKLINSPEFKKPISDSTARAMMNELDSDSEKTDIKESVFYDDSEALTKYIEDVLYTGKFMQAAWVHGAPTVKELKEEGAYRIEHPKGRAFVIVRFDMSDKSDTTLKFTIGEKHFVTDKISEAQDIILKELRDAYTKLFDIDLDESCTEKESLEEGIFDKIKDKVVDTADKIASKLKSREDKANWILEKALDGDDKKFNAFIVIGFKDTYSNGKEITMAPSLNNKDLVVGMEAPAVKNNYEQADKYAKGWSLQQGNGPAIIYLAKDANDQKAAPVCEYFKGEIAHDQLEKYFEAVKNDLKGRKLMNQSEEEQAPAADGDTGDTTTDEAAATTESLEVLMNNVEDLQESALESLISDSLIEAYGNVAGFRLKDCAYLDEKLTVSGTIHFTSGKTRSTSYTFTEALTYDNGKADLQGFNEKLGLDKCFTITGYTDTNKTFITEAFKYTKK